MSSRITKAKERWYALCDAAMVAPDTLRSAEWLAARYRRETGKPMSAARVRALEKAAWDQ